MNITCEFYYNWRVDDAKPCCYRFVCLFTLRRCDDVSPPGYYWIKTDQFSEPDFIIDIAKVINDCGNISRGYFYPETDPCRVQAISFHPSQLALNDANTI